MIASIFSFLFFSVISLDGLVGGDLSARAHFDANNVRVGDPMILMIDFVGDANFENLHPPKLAKEVDKKIWKIDDESAKTETVATARRLTYRVRPLKVGLLKFPQLDFSFTRDGETNLSRIATREIPVHVKPGAQAALAGLESDAEGLPMPDGLHFSIASRDISDDDLFRWQKACRESRADGFANFDFPESRLNEAACHILEGNWAKALKIYSRLEWRIGQTEEIENGIIAALARKHNSPSVELPVWRVAMRPILRFAWAGRLLAIASVVLAIIILYWICSRLIRLFATLAIICLFATNVNAQSDDPFEAMDRQMQNMMNRMNSMMNISMNGATQPRPEVSARLAIEKKEIIVGETFEIVLSLETKKGTTLEGIRLDAPRSYPFLGTQTGEISVLANEESNNSSNVVKRLAIPVRFDVPFDGKIAFIVKGMASGRQENGTKNHRSSFSFSTSFTSATPPIAIKVNPLQKENQPKNFSGAVGTDFSLRQGVDRTRVATNDVVTITAVLDYRGYVPNNAFDNLVYDNRREGKIIWKKYFIANGEEKVPAEKFVYYDANAKDYKTLVATEYPLTYVATDELATNETVAMDASEKNRESRVIELRFAPATNSPVIATIATDENKLAILETSGRWQRVKIANRSGWILKN